MPRSPASEWGFEYFLQRKFLQTFFAISEIVCYNVHVKNNSVLHKRRLRNGWRLSKGEITVEELRDKAVNGLECCLNDPNEFGDCASKECPYKGVNCQSDLLRDTLVLLKTQDKELELLRKVKRGEIKKYANADFVIINGDFYRKYPPLCATTEPRVLSLEEANKYCAKGDSLEISEKQPLYVEYKGGGRP